MTLVARIFVTTFILHIAAGCSIPSMYQGQWNGRWSWMVPTNVTTTDWTNDRGTFVCTGIHDYEDEPEAKTILLKDPNAIKGYIYCYYCLYVSRVNADELQNYFRDTICSSYGAPTVDYACVLTKPSSNRLKTLTRKQEQKKRGLFW